MRKLSIIVIDSFLYAWQKEIKEYIAIAITFDEYLLVAVLSMVFPIAMAFDTVFAVKNTATLPT